MDSELPSFLVWSLCIKCLVHHEVYSVSWSCLLSFLCNPYIPFQISEIFYLLVYIYYIVRPTAPGWPRATRKRSRPDHTCKYIIRIYTCIHMYTYVYTWSKLAYCESNNASHGNDKRGYREATETPREATEAPRRPRRSPLSPTKATEIIAKTALQIPAF